MLLNCSVENTLESSLDCKEIQPVNPKGNQSWIFIGRTDAKAETPILWPPDVKNWLLGKGPDAGKDWRQEEKRTTEDETAGWRHWLDGRESEWAPGVGDAQGGLAICSSQCHRVRHDWATELNADSMTVFQKVKRRITMLPLLFSCSAISDSLWPYGLQHARLPCPSPSPRVCPSSCSLHLWCCPAISSSDALFSFCPQSFPASRTFPMSRLSKITIWSSNFTSGYMPQSIKSGDLNRYLCSYLHSSIIHNSQMVETTVPFAAWMHECGIIYIYNRILFNL